VCFNMTISLNTLLPPAFFLLLGFLPGGVMAALFFRSKLTRADQLAASLNAQVLKISEERSAALSRLEHLGALETRLDEFQRREDEARKEMTALKQHIAQLETVVEKERVAASEKIALLENVKAGMTDAYRALSANALEKNNQSFIELANSTFSRYLESAKTDFDARSRAVKEVVEPVKEALHRYDDYVRQVERMREKAYGGLSEQIVSLIKTQGELQKETGKLVKAMRVPHVRGRWGEITLRRVAEMAGMENRCDFFEQPTCATENGALRPDMIVEMPGNRRIVVDSKVPVSAYLDSLEADSDEERNERLTAHARHVQTHIQQLAQKSYWAQFQPAPEFVVMFIPGENFFSAALAQNNGLIEYGVERGVIPATPTTLITLLKTVAFGWRQETMTENAKLISQLGAELYERLNVMARHLHKLGKDIDRCAQTYNQAAGSFEGRVLTAARKFESLGLGLKSGKELLTLDPVETRTRDLSDDDTE